MRFSEDAIFRITPESFDDIDDWITAAKHAGRNVRYGMDALAMLMAYTNYAIAREMSAGPLDRGAGHGRSRAKVRQLVGRRFVGQSSGPSTPQPRYKHDDAAWKIPVRRITENYYNGWKVKRIAPSLWALINDSREAFFIEFGIHPSGMRVEGKGGKYYLKGSRRVRRPIRKLSLKRTLAFVDQSRAGALVWEQIFSPFRQGANASNRGDLISVDNVQSVMGMKSI
jgi:hypothetical protein